MNLKEMKRAEKYMMRALFLFVVVFITGLLYIGHDGTTRTWDTSGDRYNNEHFDREAHLERNAEIEREMNE